MKVQGIEAFGAFGIVTKIQEITKRAYKLFVNY